MAKKFTGLSQISAFADSTIFALADIDTPTDDSVYGTAVQFMTYSGSYTQTLTNKTIGDSLFMTERASARADVTGDGQWWVENTTPNSPRYTDDSGNDHDLSLAYPSPKTPVYAAWSGFDLPDSGDASTALQAAIDAAQDNDRDLILPPNGDFQLDSGLTIKHGQNSTTDTKRYGLSIKGNNSILRPNFTGYALSVVPRCTTADKATGRGEAFIGLYDLIFSGDLDATGKALQWGAAGFRCSSLHWSQINNMLCQNFAISDAVQFLSCRHIDIVDMSCRSGAAVNIKCSTDGDFTGDMRLHGCEFSGDATTRPLYIQGFGTSSTVEVRGIHISDCVFYGSGTYVATSGDSHMGDIWFTSCAWDSNSSDDDEYAIEILTNNASDSLISKVIFIDPYISSYPGIAIYAHGAGDSRQCMVKGGTISNIDPVTGVLSAIYVDGFDGFSVQDTKFQGCVVDDLIRVDDSVDFNINNVISRGGTVADGVALTGTSDRFRVLFPQIQNTTNLVNNSASGTDIAIITGTTGADLDVVTGTAGTANRNLKWNSDGDAVEGGIDDQATSEKQQLGDSNVQFNPGGTGAYDIQLRGASGNNRRMLWTSGTSIRWTQSCNSTAEGGSDAGSDWALARFNDSGVFQANAMLVERATGDVTFENSIAAETATIDQSSTSGAVPVLTLDQADVDEDFFKFIGTSDTNVDRALVDAANFTTPGSIVGWLKINVQDDQGTDPIVDGDYYIPFYSAPSA